MIFDEMLRILHVLFQLPPFACGTSGYSHVSSGKSCVAPGVRFFFFRGWFYRFDVVSSNLYSYYSFLCALFGLDRQNTKTILI